MKLKYAINKPEKNIYNQTDKSTYDLSFNDGLRDNNCEAPFSEF